MTDADTMLDYIAPGAATAGSWTLGAARRVRTGSTDPNDGGPFSETLQYYDGDPFVGFAQGLTRGLVTRICQREQTKHPVYS